MFNLFEKLRSDKFYSLINDYDPKALSIRRLLSSKICVMDLTIKESHDVYLYFFKDDYNLNKLYKIFEDE